MALMFLFLSSEFDHSNTLLIWMAFLDALHHPICLFCYVIYDRLFHWGIVVSESIFSKCFSFSNIIKPYCPSINDIFVSMSGK